MEGTKFDDAEVDGPSAADVFDLPCYWSRASQIREGEIPGIVGKNKSDIEIKPLKLPKGAWG